MIEDRVMISLAAGVFRISHICIASDRSGSIASANGSHSSASNLAAPQLLSDRRKGPTAMFDLVRPIVIGLIAASAIVAVAWVAAAIRNTSHLWFHPFAPVQAGAAWSAMDSWLTNITAVSSLIIGTWTQLGTGSPPLVPAKAAPDLAILFVSFAAAAGLAPIIYASFAKQAIGAGTVAGYLLAAFATIFAVAGELTALGMFISQAMLAGPARGILFGFLIAGAVFVVAYSLRTMYEVLTAAAPAPAAALTAAADAKTARADVAYAAPADPAVNSLLLVPPAKRSATL
jgi:hypothetical protein